MFKGGCECSYRRCKVCSCDWRDRGEGDIWTARCRGIKKREGRKKETITELKQAHLHLSIHREKEFGSPARVELEDGCIGAARVRCPGLARWCKGDIRERDWKENRRVTRK